MVTTFGGYTDDKGRFRKISDHGLKLSKSIFNKSNAQKLSEHGKKHLHNFAEKNKQRKIKNGERTDGTNDQISLIVDSTEMSNTDKISRLQRLLNTNHKDIDGAMLQRIKTELKDLHQFNGQSMSEPISDSVKREDYHRNERGLHQNIEFGQAQHEQEMKNLQHQSQFTSNSLNNQEEMNNAELNHYLESIGQTSNQIKRKTSDIQRDVFDDELRASGA